MKQIDLLEMITKHYHSSITELIDAVSFSMFAVDLLIVSVAILVASLAFAVFKTFAYIDKNLIIKIVKMFSKSQ